MLQTQPASQRGSRLLGSVVAALFFVSSLFCAGAQTTSAPAPAYDVASIKPAKPADGSRLMVQFGRLSANGMTLNGLIKMAYGIEDDQIADAPKWVNSQTYDIEAKVDNADEATLKNLSPDQYKLMLQSFLKDRFQLKAHWETKELPVLALVVAKDGPKLKLAKPGDTYPDGIKGPDGKAGSHVGMMRWGRGQLTGQGIPITNLVSPLTRIAGRIVEDKTGLTGNYDIDLHWAEDMNSGGGGSPDASGPSIYTALQEQLGLKLESQKGPVQVLVLDHVEQPSEN
jgi:uncharacterized protein (TIGR03435 family)